MGLSENLEYSSSRKIGLAQAVAGQPLRHWTADGSFPDVFYSSVSGLWIVGVVADGSDLTSQASVAAVDASGGFYWDQATERVYVTTPYLSFTLVQALASWWIATHPRDFATEDHDHEPRIIGAPQARIGVNSYFGGDPKTGDGSIEIVNHDQLFDAFPNLNFDAGFVKLWGGADVLK